MPIRHATFNQLRIFEALSRHLSVARTAEALHLSPPAISIQVKQLADLAGQPLTEQIGKQLYLTPAGEILADACRDIHLRLDRASQDLAQLQGVERGSLRLAILTTTKYLIPRYLGGFCERHPNLEVFLHVGNRKDLLERLSHNLDDIYVLGHPPEKPAVIAIPFVANPLVAVSHPDHPLVQTRQISPERLAEEPFIAREPGSGTRLAYEAFFQERQLTMHIRMESASNEAIKQMVAGRLGISILSEYTVRTELASGELARLDVSGLPLIRQWYFVYPQGKQLSPAARTFLDFMADLPAAITAQQTAS